MEHASRVRPSRRVRVVLTVLCVLLLLVALVGLAARFHSGGRPTTLALAAVAPYLMSASGVALVLALVARQWIVAAVAVVVAAAWVATQAPLYVSADAPASATRLVVMTANLRLGQADPDAVVAAVTRHHVDVLMLEELTSTEIAALTRAGLDTALPHHTAAVGTAGDASGTGLWSRYPLSDERQDKQFRFVFLTARVAVPGLAAAPTVVALHMSGPVPLAFGWQHDIGRLPGALQALPRDAPVVVGGDFNATPDTKQFRAVLGGGYADAADQAGAGITQTYPSNRWFPPLLAIDHVVSRGAVATALQTVTIAGSDHRALLTTVALPSD